MTIYVKFQDPIGLHLVHSNYCDICFVSINVLSLCEDDVKANVLDYMTNKQIEIITYE